MRMLKSPFRSSMAVMLALALVGCEGPKHKMVEPPAGKKTICRLCYDEIQKVPHPRYGTPIGIIRRHQCEECRSDMSIYQEDGVMKIRCGKCAPEGLDCDKCLPPD